MESKKSDETFPTKDLMNREKSVSGDKDEAEHQNVTNSEPGIVSVLDYLFSYLLYLNSLYCCRAVLCKPILGQVKELYGLWPIPTTAPSDVPSE